MHRGHDHDHPFHGGGFGSGGLGGGDGGTARAAPLPARGHNRTGATVAQWQTPHLDKSTEPSQLQAEPDLDQVELAFVEGFASAADPTSFLRLANVPFEATTDSGETLALLRVETDTVVDVGSVMPHLGGASFRYDPLPTAMATKRQRLRFVYFDGNETRLLSFAEVRSLSSHA
jgi:hypothetical protein